MEVLIRERRSRADGIEEYLDTELSVATVRIGSAPDQTLQLIGPTIQAQHAQITLDGRPRVTCRRRDLRVVVNGAPRRSAPLETNDTIELDGHLVKLVEPPSGFDLALEVTPNPAVNSSDFAGAFRTELEQTWLSKRRVAWTLFAGVLLLGLLIPLGELWWFQGKLKHPHFSVDDQWSTGALLPAHSLAIGDDCGACHALAFVRVRDRECKACHGQIEDHIAAPKMVEAGIAHARCASCHQEHNEPPHMIVSSDRLCTSCHAQPARFEAIATLQPALGFALSTHPAFAVDLLRPVVRSAGTGELFDWRHESVPLKNAHEVSNLRFPHDVHLDPAKVTKVSDGSALSCSDCHRLAPDGEHFVPVTMEKDCRSCHDLKFDPTDPARQLPHGQPQEAILAIEGHYLRKYSDPNLATMSAMRRRLPDRRNEDEHCTERPFDCAMRRTREETILQFTRRGCITCHVVEDTKSDDIYSRFQVYPIRLVRDYLPAARFDHLSHLTQKGVTGDAACSTCHDAVHSSHSSDVLIPDIDNCVQCHGDRKVKDSVVLPCIGCHIYHPDSSAQEI